ncbi:Fe2+-dependent dioxygenase [Ovoidimarina sediminis]|uniref:Fe2+-dependent dioxygenase n=1 Tax=Ovoidimarina sediminis TaxID=3079856 RepID=UPI0029071CC5|nr:Fe2+-dependent dioxygenase [Rhodophyticola sp. MJ-SS7]MDU8945069.1 Fe2+-dependent dioxygenase [Rhodophyticola sp. MJ-SS7]
MFLQINNILTPDEVATIRDWMMAHDFVDGRATAGYRAKRVKNNEQIGNDATDRNEIDNLVLSGLRRSTDFRNLLFPARVQRPLLSRYREGMDYGLHVDDALMGADAQFRTDVSVTLFLSDPESYDGGELEIHSTFGIRRQKAPAGAVLTYPSSTLHRVVPVTRGERLAAVTWVQSRVRDPERRETLRDLDRICQKMQAVAPDSDETDLAFKTRANLLRSWAE